MLKQSIFAVGVCLLLVACTGARDTSPELFHGIEITEENKAAVQQMDADEYAFLTKVLGPFTFDAPMARILNNLGRPARDVVYHEQGSRKLWTLELPNSTAYISIYFDKKGHTIRIEMDGGDAYFYGQNLRELTETEQGAIEFLQNDPEFAEYQ